MLASQIIWLPAWPGFLWTALQTILCLVAAPEGIALVVDHAETLAAQLRWDMSHVGQPVLSVVP